MRDDLKVNVAEALRCLFVDLRCISQALENSNLDSPSALMCMAMASKTVQRNAAILAADLASAADEAARKG